MSTYENSATGMFVAIGPVAAGKFVTGEVA